MISKHTSLPSTRMGSNLRDERSVNRDIRHIKQEKEEFKQLKKSWKADQLESALKAAEELKISQHKANLDAACKYLDMVNTGESIKNFKSIAEASRRFGESESTIRSCYQAHRQNSRFHTPIAMSDAPDELFVELVDDCIRNNRKPYTVWRENEQRLNTGLKQFGKDMFRSAVNRRRAQPDIKCTVNRGPVLKITPKLIETLVSTKQNDREGNAIIL